MQMPTAAIDVAAVIGAGAEHGRHGLGLDDFEVIAVSVLDALFDVAADVFHVAGTRGNLHPPVLEIAGDGVFRDTVLDDLVAAVADVAHELSAGFAELGLGSLLRR